MKFDRLIALLPAQSLEDLSLKRDAVEAHSLLAAWTVLWHPVLLAQSGSLPSWIRAEAPPENHAGLLATIPSASRYMVADDWAGRAEADGACVIDDCTDRQAMLDAILSRLDAPLPQVDSELAADFMALGMAQMLIELLTRQMRYMSNMDEGTLQSRTVEAAQAAVAGNVESSRSSLQSAFDVLREAREYFYPIESYLLDLTLVAPGTVGESLRDEFARGGALNLLITGEALEEMARYEPETLRQLKDALQAKRVTLVGGDWDEPPLALMGPEAIAEQLDRGLAAFDRHLGQRPTLYGRRRFGLSPILPQLLRKKGFTTALHFTLDDGRFPTGNQSRIQWEGIDGTTIDALARVPLDAARDDVFLRLPEKLGDILDLDHAGTLIFAHWPGQASPWYREMQRVARQSNVLGNPGTLDEYLSNSSSGQTVAHPLDQYRSPYLRQAADAGRTDAISRYRQSFVRRAAVDALGALRVWRSLAENRPLEAIPADLLPPPAEGPDSATDDPRVDARLQEAVEQEVVLLGQALGGESGGPKGCLWFNTTSARYRVACVDSPPPTGESAEPHAPVAAGLDVPSLGYAWFGPGPHPEEQTASRRPVLLDRKGKAAAPLAEGYVLRNEYLEATLNKHTGAIQTVIDFSLRGNRLGQQIAARLPAPSYAGDYGYEEYGYSYNTEYAYSIMAADEIRVQSSGPAVGEIVARGRLMSQEGKRLAGFTQLTRLRRGSRILELEIELDPEWLPDDDPWRSYYAARFAWKDDAAEVFRDVGLAARQTEIGQVEAPYFVDLRAGKARTTLLAGGHCFHRRVESRVLDTLLVVRGESARTFRLGVGFELPSPAAAALQFIGPSTVVPSIACPSEPSQRFFQFNARNVVALRWEPVVREGRIAGFRVRLLETGGEETTLRLRSFRRIAAACKLDALEPLAAAVPVEDGQACLALRRHEWTWIECLYE